MRVVASFKGGTTFPGSSENHAPVWRNRGTSGHVDSLALVQFLRIKLVNIKKINQNMVINLTVHTCRPIQMHQKRADNMLIICVLRKHSCSQIPLLMRQKKEGL